MILDFELIHIYAKVELSSQVTERIDGACVADFALHLAELLVAVGLAKVGGYVRGHVELDVFRRACTGACTVRVVLRRDE